MTVVAGGFALLLCLMGAGRQSPPPLPWGLGFESAGKLLLPVDIRQLIKDDLEYAAGDSAEAIRFDFNRDGVADYLVVSSLHLCGNGGCGYRLIDGSSRKVVGAFSGTPLYVLPNFASGFPVVKTYAHSSADSGVWTTYAFDGTRYAITDQRLLAGAANDSALTVLRAIPTLRARAPRGQR